MADRDPIRVGTSGVLRVQFLDAAFVPIEATSVTVDLFAPGLDPAVDTPTVAALVPVHIGDGIFELTFTPIAPGGGWIDKWTGTIIGTVTSTTQRFTVLNDGFIASYPLSGLRENQLITLTLDSSISDTSGTSLEEDDVILFTTQYSPLYSSVRKVKLEAGGLLGNIPDDTVNLSILEASIEADVLSFNKTLINSDLYTHAKREYVTSNAAIVLAQNVLANGGILKSKFLADFKVEYDTGILSSLLDRLHANAKRWLDQIMSGGGARKIRNPQGVVKGEYDPDRPQTGKMWEGIRTGETPIGNTKKLPYGSRRWRTTFTSNKPGSDW